MRRGQFLDATRGGMQTQLQFVERKCAANRNDQLAVENELLLRQFCNVGHNIGKITRERLPILRLQINFSRIAKSQAAKSIPFRLILPTLADWNLFGCARFHWWYGRFEQHSKIPFATRA